MKTNNEFIPVSLTGSTPLLACPICKEYMVHPIAVECLPAGRTNSHVIITHDGLTVRPARLDKYYMDGVRITLRFLCESLHQFAYCFEFSHGTTSVERHEKDDDPRLPSPHVIWRA